MSTFPWKPIRLARDLGRRVDELFAEIVEGGWGDSSAARHAADDLRIEETERAFVVRLALPDVAAETVQIHIDDDWVRISGSRRTAALARSDTHVVHRQQESHFCRTFRLPAAVDTARIHVARDGVLLVVTLPKLGADDPRAARRE